jgi:hypothetical protein
LAWQSGPLTVRHRRQLTPEAVAGVTTNQSFSGAKARRDLNYTPMYDQAAALARTAAFAARQAAAAAAAPPKTKQA